MIFHINGNTQDLNPGSRTLLEILRDDLGLVGAREGCGIGTCGACTVLIDDKPISSCLMLGQLAAGKEILTIEGLTVDGKIHPVQQAFIDNAAFQCAYCTPGFVLTTIALLKQTPNPTQDQITTYLSGNLCRCGSYKNIITAIASLQKA